MQSTADARPPPRPQTVSLVYQLFRDALGPLARVRGVNLAGIRLLFELEERLGTRILEALYAEGTRADREAAEAEPDPDDRR